MLCGGWLTMAVVCACCSGLPVLPLHAAANVWRRVVWALDARGQLERGLRAAAAPHQGAPSIRRPPRDLAPSRPAPRTACSVFTLTATFFVRSAQDYMQRKEAGTLTVSKMQQKLMHHLQPVQLTKANAGDSVKFGDTLLMWNHAAESFVATDLGDSEARDDGATHCAATATKYSYPCARNALELSRVANDGFPEDDAVLHYGQTVRFSTTEALGDPLYLHSYHHTPVVCSKYTRAQEATFGSVPEQYTLWKVMHVNPQARLETDGEPVPINTAVVIVHVCTNSLLAASKAPYANDFQIEHGDTEMCVKTYAAISKCNYGTRSHEFEGAENHFVMVAEKPEEEQ